MSKKYFTKYLQYNKPLKDGDIGIMLLVDDEVKPFKLFLCSREIEVGDKLRTFTGDSTIPVVLGCEAEREALQTGIDNYKLFNVIGEVSPDAIWVVEDMEFDENEVKILYQIWDAVLWVNVSKEELEGYRGKQKRRTHCRIKGPCGHFH